MSVLRTHINISKEQVQSPLQNEGTPQMRMHKNVETLHYPYPASLLSFNESEVLDPRHSALKKWTQTNRYGDEEPLTVVDNIKYRVSEVPNVYRSFFGYAPKEPIQEVQTPMDSVVISHEEVQLRVTENGIELVSLYEVPFTAYELLKD